MSWHPVIRYRSRAMVRRERRAGAARPQSTRLPCRVEPGALPIVIDRRTDTAVTGPLPSRTPADGSVTAPEAAAGRAVLPTPACPVAPSAADR